jgi:hypothetical protein
LKELLSKKLITTIIALFSLNYVALLIYKDTLDATHKIELYSLLIVAISALAGVHGLLQSKIDKQQLEKNKSESK